MANHHPRPEQGLSTARIEALTDGVVAIAMTLMVFYIKVPELPSPAATGALLPALLSLWPSFVSSVISFVMIGVYWVGHHNQFHYIRRTDRVMLWINILFLMFISLIPFSSSLLGHYPRQRAAITLYGLNLMMVGVSLYIHWSYATQELRLVDANTPPQLIVLAKRRILTGPILVVATALSFVSTRLGLLLYALLPVLYLLPGRIDRHWAPRAPVARRSRSTG